MGKIEQSIPRSIGRTIAALRKNAGLSQTELADRLFISNKTVSKWERGAGYPEITMLPHLCDVLGISVDSLLRGERSGIAIAGNILTDNVKVIDAYPRPTHLADISMISRAVGGCVPNTLIDLAKIDSRLPLYAIGRVGDDDGGRYVLSELKKYGVRTSGIRVSDRVMTSFSDVMSVAVGGERTFFHFRGANAEFSPEDVDISALGCRMLHVGYLLLLDRFDVSDPEYGTVMAHFLSDVKRDGISTSFDLVSSNDREQFARVVVPALRYTDNAFMNETEAEAVTGISVRDSDGKINISGVRAAMERLLSLGTRERVILHAPEAGFLYSAERGFVSVPSLSLPAGYIKGSVGAGDAFTAGCLYGIYHGMSDEEILTFAAGTAAASLSAEDSVSGMKNEEEVWNLIRTYRRGSGD